jgi:tetratricopeptide (TPR) repeat protein
MAVVVYANSVSNGFVGDDKEQLLQNPLVSGHHVAQVFGSGVWAFRGVQGNYYRPIQFLVYIALHATFGYSATAFHFFMLLLHVANTLLVYRLAERLVANTRVAAAAAALFAVHPIHTETVDWVAALPDLLLTTIVIFAVWTFIRRDGPPAAAWIVAYCGLYLLALMTKETGIMLLPLFVGYDWIGARSLRRHSPLYTAMAATLAIYVAARWSALGGLAPAQQTFHHLTPAEFAFSAVTVAGEYLAKLIVPAGLNYFHIFTPTRGLRLALLGSMLAIGAAAALAVAVRRKVPAVSYGVLWIALTIAPALNLTGVGQNVFAERYLYLPSVGFVWMAALAWEWCRSRRPSASWAAGIAILAAFSWEAVARNGDWRDEYTLLRETVAQSPGAGILHNNLAGVYVDRGDLVNALAEEQQAVTLEPLSAPFHKNLGLLLMARDPRAAIPEFEAALRLQPSDASLKGLIEEARAATAR